MKPKFCFWKTDQTETVHFLCN